MDFSYRVLILNSYLFKIQIFKNTAFTEKVKASALHIRTIMHFYLHGNVYVYLSPQSCRLCNSEAKVLILGTGQQSHFKVSKCVNVSEEM